VSVFPLVPRRRVIGLAFGGMQSVRRGIGSDVASSRPYRPGDPFDDIDWKASAKLSAAHDADEFVVRERFAEEAPRVVVVCDRRPSLAIDAAPLRALRKPVALRHAIRLIADSALAARSYCGYLDLAGGEAFWRPPRSEHAFAELDLDRRFDAPPDSLERSLAHLAEHRHALSSGAFVFVLSDFLAPPPERAWRRALELRWELVPVVVQDPVWEQTFPDVAGIGIRVADAATGRAGTVWLTEAEAAERRAANETRFAELLRGFRALGVDPVVVSSSDAADVLAAFLTWADMRQYARGGRG
jgi:uncharacterized protein (DUF58 family)